MFARPDLLWYRALRPWCSFGVNRTSLQKVIVKHDYAFLLPGRHMHALLRAPHEDYLGCREDLVPGKTIEHYQRGLWRRHGVWKVMEARSSEKEVLPARIFRLSDERASRSRRRAGREKA